ncbi:glycosyltransferase [Sphingomonas sp.]|uniref:glycosyltransferase n=1 Tax=Sphingomonas sp. TaxID=28214 RepID=UPI003B009C45
MTARRSVLLVHQNFPGQFPHIARALLARGDRVAAIGSASARGMPGVDLRRWSNAKSTTPGLFPHAVRAEADLIRAAAAADTAVGLRRDGFMPDVIIGNPGWGETLHLKEVWPEAKLILLGEYYYVARGGDLGFDPEFTAPDFGVADAVALNARNATQAFAYVLADRIVCPTPFQASTFPASLRERITVHHEGIDIAAASRRPAARMVLPDGKVLVAGDPVVTFISRTLEPLRGFHIFMRALPALLAERPDAHVVVIGTDAEQGYGAAAPGGSTWKDAMLRELGGRIDLARVHFLGRVPHATMVAALSLSAAHVYLTYPFVLSWSLIEAMACGCLIVGSDTAPVRDAIVPGENGLLVDFFDVAGLSVRLVEAVSHPASFMQLREGARATVVRRYDASAVGIPGWLSLIDDVISA